MNNLIKKYNVSGPRYTSYPTVPYWSDSPSIEAWKEFVKTSFQKTNKTNGISVYIHLPFCESLCTFCGCNTRITVNHAVEDPYITAVLKEWKMYVNVFGDTPLIKEIHLGGGTPTFFSPKNLKLLINSIKKFSSVHPQAEFSFEAHPNSTTKEHLQTLYNVGFRRLSLGIQDFDPKVQETVNRVQSFETVERVVNEAGEIGYTSINFDLIYGLPFQTENSIIDTIEKTKLLKPGRIAFYSYAHVPWIKPSQRAYTEKDLPQDEAKRKLYELGKKLFQEAAYIEIGMDHFSLETDSLNQSLKHHTLHRNFMGYSSSFSELMVGLGVSSISDSWNCFAQNVKKVEDYYKLIDQNQIPIFRGHILNQEDLLIRKHILNLMCSLETSWKNPEEQSQSIYEGLERLKEMQNDGLVEILPYQLKVTKKGRAFVRNICMAFDERLWKNVPSTQIFSQTV
jgi:oxygen-independent coproporphyrinogen-3 oxidase